MLLIQICQVTRIERVTHALLEVHTQKNIREVSHTFPNIFEYIFETPCSKVSSKTGFQRMYSVLKMQQYVFAMVSVELQILFKFEETGRNIHFVI